MDTTPFSSLVLPFKPTSESTLPRHSDSLDQTLPGLPLYRFEPHRIVGEKIRSNPISFPNHLRPKFGIVRLRGAPSANVGRIAPEKRPRRAEVPAQRTSSCRPAPPRASTVQEGEAATRTNVRRYGSGFGDDATKGRALAALKWTIQTSERWSLGRRAPLAPPEAR
jgi:hypothetical protein